MRLLTIATRAIMINVMQRLKARGYDADIAFLHLGIFIAGSTNNHFSI
jgi:hypothetical protein